MLSPSRRASSRGRSGRLSSRVAPVVDDAADLFWIRVIKTTLCLVTLAIVVFVPYYFYWRLRSASIKICASVCSLRVSAYDEVSFAIELVISAIAWILCVSGLWNNIGEADQVELFCVVLPLVICTYFIGFSAPALRAEMFYVQSQSMGNRICKSTLVSLLAALVYCYGQEHEVLDQHGKVYVEEKMQGIGMMPIIIVLPLMPLLLTLFENHHEKGEARARRPRTLALTYP